MRSKIENIWIDDIAVYIQTGDGKIFSEKFNDYPRLKYATTEQRKSFTYNNIGIRWEELDEDLSFEGFMNKKNNKETTLFRLFKNHPELNVAGIARRIGISQSVMASYVCGIKKPSPMNMELVEKQQKLRENNYKEVLRYMDNAKDSLKKAGKEDGYYQDRKYIKTACGTAYNGVLLALDTYLMLKGIPRPHKKKRLSIEYYESNIGQLDKKLLKELDVVYHVLHLDGYYDGIQDAMLIKKGFDTAFEIINRIKP